MWPFTSWSSAAPTATQPKYNNDPEILKENSNLQTETVQSRQQHYFTGCVVVIIELAFDIFVIVWLSEPLSKTKQDYLCAVFIIWTIIVSFFLFMFALKSRSKTDVKDPDLMYIPKFFELLKESLDAPKTMTLTLIVFSVTHDKPSLLWASVWIGIAATVLFFVLVFSFLKSGNNEAINCWRYFLCCFYFTNLICDFVLGSTLSGARVQEFGDLSRFFLPLMASSCENVMDLVLLVLCGSV